MCCHFVQCWQRVKRSYPPIRTSGIALHFEILLVATLLLSNMPSSMPSSRVAAGKFLPKRSKNVAMTCYEHVYPWQKWALTFSFSSYCILIAAWCRQDGREQSVHQRWAEHVRWSSQHERRVVQHMPGHQTSRPTESWASNQIPQYSTVWQFHLESIAVEAIQETC